MLIMFNEHLNMTNQLSECLQDVKVDIAKAVRVVSVVKLTLESNRSDTSLNLWNKLEDLWKELNVVDVESELERFR